MVRGITGKLIRYIWMIAVLLNFSSNVLLIIAATANFQRKMDLLSRFVLCSVGIISAILIITSIAGLFSKRVNRSAPSTFISAIIISALLLMLIPFNIHAVDSQKQGWIYDQVHSDPLRYTTDGVYTYKIELVNISNRDRSTRLYVQNNLTKEAWRMDVPVQYGKDEILTFGHGEWSWGKLVPGQNADEYELMTTSLLDAPVQHFKVDLKLKKASRLE